MSTVVMSACWPLQMPPTPKAVLVSLADNANDHGECWPSIPTIAARTCFTERSVQRAIHWLETEGLLVADRSNGRHTRYKLTPPTLLPLAKNPRQSVTPDRKTPLTQSREPLTESREPPSQSPSNRQEPSRTVNSIAQRCASRFPEFWNAYPKKVGKQPALAKWKAKRLDAIADRLIDDVRKRIAEDGRWLDGYVPDPKTYLTQERWEDDMQPRRDAPQAAPTASGPGPARQSESPLERAVAWARQQHHFGAIDEAERDRLIEVATDKYREMEAA